MDAKEDALTRGEKSFRDKACYPIIQPLWWLLLPPRLLLSGLVQLGFSEEWGRWAWRKIFTPANFLTAARLCLLGNGIALFFAGAPLYLQAQWLFFAIITDFFDGPLARSNGEVTELGTFLDHTGDYGVVLWAIFLSFWYGTLPLPFLAVALAVLPALFAVYVAKFIKFYDGEAPFLRNIEAFAAEELQTDIWGRIQFFALAVALFGGLFISASGEEGFLFAGLMQSVSETAARATAYGALALSIFLGGYNTQEALDYSELKAKAFREKLRRFKGGPS